MSTFEGVSVAVEANIYFEGKVTSRLVYFPDGTRKTLGILLPGEYHFNTDSPENIKINSGAVEYRLPEGVDWIKVESGGEFYIPERSSFDIRALTVVDYVCSYL